MKSFLPLLLSGSIFLASSAFAEYQRLDGVVAIVDEDIITESDVRSKTTMVYNNMRQQNLPIPPEEEVRKQVIERLIVENIQMQMAKQAGITVNDERLNQAMASIAQRNKLDLAAFREELLSQGIDYNEMREQVRSEMIQQQVQQGNLRNRVTITEQEIANFLASAEGKHIVSTRYRLAHVLLPVAESANDAEEAQARDALTAIRHQVLQGQLQFGQLIKGQNLGGVMISGNDFGWQSVDELPSLFAEKALEMDAGDISAPIRSGAGWHLLMLAEKTGGGQLVEQTHSRHILVSPSEVRSDQQAQELAYRLYERALKGEDFTLLAKEYSEDKGSAMQGGDLGWTSPGQFVPEFEQTLQSLAVNEIARPVKSQFGWHVIQKLGQRSHDMTQENWKMQAQQAIFERKFTSELEAWLVKIREEAFVEIK